MNLHHSGKTPDWETIEPSQRSFLQRIAAGSHGLITLPNLISVIGFALVVVGLVAITSQQYLYGAGLILVGRLFDIVDGMVADVTRTKGPVGEFVDACLDKVAIVLTVLVFLQVQLAAWWVITLLLIPQIVIVIVTFIVRRQGRSLHPSLAGKYSMALSWVGLAGLLLAKVIDDSPLVSLLSLLIILVAVVLSFMAIKAYLKSDPSSVPAGTPRN